MRPIRTTGETPCNCVFRAVFRACYNRFRDLVAKGCSPSAVSLDFCRGRESRRAYSRKREDYMADFCLVSQRHLDGVESQVFRYHFLLGADWKLCCRRLNIDRGNFFHAVYRIEQRLGRVFAELEPYPLYPLDEYFGHALRKEPTRALQPPAILSRAFVPRARVELRLSA